MTDTQDSSSGTHRMSRHTLIMLIGCLVPLGILAVLWLAGVKMDYLFFGVLLLCPALHLFMMRGMQGKEKHPHGTASALSPAAEEDPSE